MLTNSEQACPPRDHILRITCFPIHMLFKRKPRVQNAIIYVKGPTLANQDLTPNLTQFQHTPLPSPSPVKRNLLPDNREFSLVSTGQCTDRATWPETMDSLLITSFLLPLPLKTFPLLQLYRAPIYLLDGMPPGL